MEIKNAHFTDIKSVIEALKPGYPVYCLHPADLERTAKMYLENFPGRILYAVKCNPHPVVLK